MAGIDVCFPRSENPDSGTVESMPVVIPQMRATHLSSLNVGANSILSYRRQTGHSDVTYHLLNCCQQPIPRLHDWPG
jgi:hypothetical protein